jgi:hypothetical protein
MTAAAPWRLPNLGRHEDVEAQRPMLAKRRDELTAARRGSFI